MPRNLHDSRLFQAHKSAAGSLRVVMIPATHMQARVDDTWLRRSSRKGQELIPRTELPTTDGSAPPLASSLICARLRSTRLIRDHCVEPVAGLNASDHERRDAHKKGAGVAGQVVDLAPSEKMHTLILKRLRSEDPAETICTH